MGYAVKKFYVAVCDGCDAEHEHNEFSAWADLDQAITCATDDDWEKQDDGRLLCFDCRCKRGGDIYAEVEADIPVAKEAM